MREAIAILDAPVKEFGDALGFLCETATMEKLVNKHSFVHDNERIAFFVTDGLLHLN